MSVLVTVSYWMSVAALVAYGALELFTRGRGQAAQWSGAPEDRRSTAVVIAGIVVALLAPWLLRDVGNFHGNWRIIGLVGAAVAVAGVFLRVRAMTSLAGSYTRTLRIQDGQQLVTTGVYAHLRHPGYTSTILTLTGAALGFQTWAGGLFAAVVLTSCYLYRIRVEETMLARAFPDTWPDYTRHSHRLVPGVW
ncbi:methyltransferase family protein [Gordonia sp. NPDC003425]